MDTMTDADAPEVFAGSIYWCTAFDDDTAAEETGEEGDEGEYNKSKLCCERR